MVGEPKRRTLTVRNVGTIEAEVAVVCASDVFAAPFMPCLLRPDGSAVVEVEFTPADVEPYRHRLGVIGGARQIVVQLRGSGGVHRLDIDGMPLVVCCGKEHARRESADGAGSERGRAVG